MALTTGIGGTDTTDDIISATVNDDWFRFILASLACFRLTRLITDDKISSWLRSLVVREAPTKLKKKAREGINCPFCVSFYIAALITVTLILCNLVTLQFSFVYQAAVWGASVLLNQLFTKLSK